MDTSELQKPCIEVKVAGEALQTFSVREYEATLRRARSLGSPAARDEEGIRWANDARPSEKLTLEEQQPWMFGPRLRICNWGAYDVQMRQLLGIL